MNARSSSFEFTCLGKKIKDITCALFHSIVFNRCFGKLRYEHTSSYAIGTLGFEEVVCDFIDFTYVQVSSSELVAMINKEIGNFVNALRSTASVESLASNSKFSTSPARSPPIYSKSPPNSSNCGPSAAVGQISISFLIKPSGWRKGAEPLIWEVWSIKFNCLHDDCDEENSNKTPIEEQLSDRVLSIVQIVNNSQFMPQMPTQSEVSNVFDTSFSDAQPYNFKISYKINSSGNELRSTDDRQSTQQALTRFLKTRLAL